MRLEERLEMRLVERLEMRLQYCNLLTNNTYTVIWALNVA